MSDMCIPDLVQLNSYWQKAVEDAIRDTVKGEEKLLNALRNRKKINEKLKTYGLEPVFPVWPYKKGTTATLGSQMESKSCSEESIGTEEGSPDTFNFNGSKSSDSPIEDEKQKSPIRSLFGNGSLEKIKRSQNSFNYEPMGEDGNSDIITETEKEENEFFTNFRKNSDLERGKNNQMERNKNIQWLHVRDFKKSNSDSSSDEEKSIHSPQTLRHSFPSKKHTLNRSLRSNCEKKVSRMSKKAQKSISSKESNSAMAEQKKLKQRLELALAKREILSKKRKILNGGKSEILIKVSRSTAKAAEGMKERNQLSAFIKFYLQIYKDLCLKVPVKRIAEEASKRWRSMCAKERAEWAKSRKPADF